MKKVLILILIVVFFLSGAVLWWNTETLPVNSQDKTPVIFVVGKGDSVREIASNLKEKGLIKNPISFFLLVKKLGLDKKIEAGDFRLNPSMTSEEVAFALTHGTLDIWITVPEGQRANEIADTLKKEIPSYDPSWRNDLLANEGYLFPDTYLIPRSADINLIISTMRNNFNKKFEKIKNSKATNLTDQEIIILASLIEREAKFAKDQPLVASVIINRLSLQMPLQIDATVQYVLGYQPKEKTWWKRYLTFDDLELSSPYNTYVKVGFPPTPIANPGESALDAAVNPPETDYLYYVSDKSGNLHFAKTLEGHNFNIKKYEVR